MIKAARQLIKAKTGPKEWLRAEEGTRQLRRAVEEPSASFAEVPALDKGGQGQPCETAVACSCPRRTLPW